MRFPDLQKTVARAVSGGKLGTPVSLRLHVQLAEQDADLAETFSAVIPLAEQLFQVAPSTLMAQQSDRGKQLNVLVHFDGGQTALFTIGAGSASQSQLHLLLVGNQGIARVEGGELFDEATIPIPDDGEPWRTSVGQSLKQQSAVTLGTE